MCGINGILRLTEQAAPIDRAELRRVRDAMALRGPDAAGEWFSPDGFIGLGHRRLAIIDLSPGGNQPMSWADERYWIVFNGEIYNYRE
ncbi:partial Asparagine synthetase [glutamine-hydrolyzing] 1, partial [Anaerolineae bacterium]